MIKLKKSQIAIVKNKTTFTEEIRFKGCTYAISPESLIAIWGPGSIEGMGGGLSLTVRSTKDVKSLKARNKELEKEVERLRTHNHHLPLDANDEVWEVSE